jgi:hypothetical protein
MLPAGRIVTATLTPDRQVQWVRTAPAPRARHGIASALVTVVRAHFGPLRERIRSRGLARAVPASLALATASLILTALVHTPSPIQQRATSLLEYRGDDLYSGELWRLVSSGLLAQSWLQYLWTLFIAVVIFAVLEVQIGWPKLLACVAASHLVPTVTVALLAPVVGHAGVLSEVDYGTSCLVVGAVAGLAWLHRSLLLAAFVAIGVIGDVMLSAPLTVIEHALALAVGTAVVAGTASRVAGGDLAPSRGRLQGRVGPAPAIVRGIDVGTGRDDLIDAVEQPLVHDGVGGGKLAFELVHRARSDDRGGYRRMIDHERNGHLDKRQAGLLG